MRSITRRDNGGSVRGRKEDRDYLYTRLEYHELTGMTYTIINKAFKSEEIYQYNDDGTYAVRDRFRKEVPLSEVDEWAACRKSR